MPKYTIHVRKKKKNSISLTHQVSNSFTRHRKRMSKLPKVQKLGSSASGWLPEFMFLTVTVLVICCRVTDYSKISKSKHYFIICLWARNQSGLSRWFWLKASLELAEKMSSRTLVIWRFCGARSFAANMAYSHRWQSHVAFGRRPHFVTMWILQRTKWVLLCHGSGFPWSKCCHFHNILLVVLVQCAREWHKYMNSKRQKYLGAILKARYQN